MPDSFEPRILAICCQWCSYAAADLAGAMRLQYPATIHIVRVPCTGRVDILHMIKPFEDGVDGVFLSGCLLDDCHYRTGNFKATKRVAYAKKMLEALGLEPKRLEMFYNSSAMGSQFAQTCIDFDARIRQLGPAFPQDGDKRAFEQVA
jgi:F420-non-reducing hydrogenase iron-sulfur subunit